MSGLEAQFTIEKPLALDVGLTVAPGEVLALVGRSGAGKSTILRALAGLQEATGRIVAGDEIWLDGQRARPPHRRSIGFLLQGYGLFPHKTARQNLLLAMGARADRGEADRLLAAVHLQGLEDALPRRLSGGQQQRVALARALARRPRLLLLDEPFSAVDRPTRRALALILHELRRDFAMPVVLVSHDIDDVRALADRIAVLEQGRIVQCGAVAEVIARPLSPGIAELVGKTG